MNIDIIKTASLGNRGYIVHDGKHAMAVDVQRDYDRWIERAIELGVQITHVAETHMHNDYVTGGYKLAEKLGASYIIPEHSAQTFTATEVSDGNVFSVGDLKVTVLHTPGHTPHHMSYKVHDDAQTALFTGGGVLYGTVGRPDLISNEMTKPLADAQYESAQKLANEVPDAAQVFPTHGFGSFCSSSPGTGADASTLADEKRNNIAFTSASKEEFMHTIISGLSAYPRYYAHMGVINRDGPDDMKIKEVEKLPAQMLKSMLAHDDWVIDIRSRKAFAAHHPEHAAGFEMSDSFSTYIGWLIPWGDSITLVGDNPDELLDAQLQLGRIGMDDFIAHVTDDIASYLSAGKKKSFQRMKHTDLYKAAKDKSVVVLDVRNDVERSEVYIDGSIQMPIHDILDRMGEIPKDKTVWVYCASGYRASIVSGLLDRAGYSVISIDDSIENAFNCINERTA